MEVYILIEDDLDPYCGYRIVGVYKTREAAKQRMINPEYQHVIEKEVEELKDNERR